MMALEGVDSWNLDHVRELQTVSKLFLETTDDLVHAQIKDEATAKVLLRKGFRLYQTTDLGSAYARPFLIARHDWEPSNRDSMLKDRWPVIMDKGSLVGFRRPAKAGHTL